MRTARRTESGEDDSHMAIPDPNNQRSRYHRDSTRPLERQQANRGVSLSRPVDARGSGRNADSWVCDSQAELEMESGTRRLGLLRGLQNLIDGAEADFLSRRLKGELEDWENDEDPIRPAVDSWDDEYGPDNRRLRWRYKTPTPHTPRLDAQETVIRRLRGLWVDADIDLQSRGWTPGTQDIDAYDRDRGKFTPAVQRSAGSGQIRDAFPELFVGTGIIAPTKSPVRPTDPWLDVMFARIVGKGKGKGKGKR